MVDTDNDSKEMLITLTADIVTAHVANNSTDAEALPSLIENIYGALSGLGHAAVEEDKPEPAVSIRASVKNDHLVCLDCGKKFKMLKRHLMTDHGMTPEEYRDRWNLPTDYSLVAPDYSQQRRTLAKDIGLGRKPGQKVGRKSRAKSS